MWVSYRDYIPLFPTKNQQAKASLGRSSFSGNFVKVGIPLCVSCFRKTGMFVDTVLWCYVEPLDPSW